MGGYAAAADEMHSVLSWQLPNQAWCLRLMLNPHAFLPATTDNSVGSCHDMLSAASMQLSDKDDACCRDRQYACTAALETPVKETLLILAH